MSRPRRGAAAQTVEVHWDALTTAGYTRAGDYASDFSPADAAKGISAVRLGRRGPRSGGFVKVRKTGSGSVEVHWDTLQNGAYRRAGDYPTDFAGALGTGIWQMPPSSTSAPDAGFIKLAPAPPPAPQAAAPTQPVTTVVLPPRARHHVHVRIALSWTWRGRHTQLRRIRVGRLPRRGRMAVVCRGRGCPRPRARAARPRRIRTLLGALDGRRFRAGDRLLITITAPGQVAQRAEVVIRNGRLPSVRLL